MTFSIPKTQSMRVEIDKLDFIKIKNLCSVKDTVKKMRRQITDWEKMFVRDTSCKELYPKHTKKFL